MKKHSKYYPFRIPVAALALGVSGLLVYQMFRQPADSPAKSIGIGKAAQENPMNHLANALKVKEAAAPDLSVAMAQNVPPSHVAPSFFTEFNEWAVKYSKAPATEQREMLNRGDAMVKLRREKMAELIEQDPALALAESDALSPLARDALPESLKNQLEQRVNARGDLEVLACFGGTASPYVRSTTFDGEKYTVYPAGENETLLNESKRSLLGIKLSVNRTTVSSEGKASPRVDRVMALRKERLRILNKDEAALALKARGKGSKAICSISAKPLAESKTAVVIETGGETKGMCKPAHSSEWLKSPEGLVAAGSPSGTLAVGGPGEGTGNLFPAVPVGKSTGNKSFLCVRFRCLDQPDTLYRELEANVPLALKQLNQWSYGKINFNSYVISPLLVLPRTYAEYKAGTYSVDDDAWGMAREAYPVSDYSFSAICVSGLWGYRGATWMLDTRMMINDPETFVFEHEIGHCIGLPHANLWIPKTADPIGPGTWGHYGGSYDTMGNDWASFGVMNKFYTRWLSLVETHNLDSRVSGTYTIYDSDVNSLTPGRKYLIRIPISSGGYYFVEFRPRPTAFSGQESVHPTTQNGIRIFRSYNSEQIDVTPLSSDGRLDAALLAGKELYDAGENIRVRAVSKGGSGTDQYFNVDVSFSNTSELATGHTFLLRSIDSNAPFGVANSSSNNGSPVSRMSSNGSPSQKWVMMKVDENNYKIVNVNSRKVLEVSGYSVANGGKIQQWDYLGTPSQKWQVVATGNGRFKLINAGSNLALSVPYASDDPTQQLQQYTYLGASNQVWALDEVNPLVSGANYAIAARHSGQVMDILSFNKENGAAVQQWPWFGASNQIWTASSQGGPLLAFTGLNAQKVLEVGGYAMGDTAGIQQWSWVGHAWQKWTLVAVDHDADQIWYTIINLGSGKAVDVPYASTQYGVKLLQYSSWGGANQQWRFSKVQ